MTVQELIDQLQQMNPDAEVMLSEIYGETGPVPVTGFLFDNNEVVLTNEDTS